MSVHVCSMKSMHETCRRTAPFGPSPSLTTNSDSDLGWRVHPYLHAQVIGQWPCVLIHTMQFMPGLHAFTSMHKTKQMLRKGGDERIC